MEDNDIIYQQLINDINKKIEENMIKRRKSSISPKTKHRSYSSGFFDSSEDQDVILCKNCNKEGHRVKNCSEPIKSYGIICYTKQGNKIYYLMINRKDTISFVDFVYGKYDTYNLNYLRKLFANMCYREKKYIETKTFDELWGLLNMKNKYRYEKSKKKYEILKNRLHKKTKIPLLEELLKVKPKYKEPEWGFPKGRKMLIESELECAIREFYEETDLTSDMIKVNPDKTYIEKYRAINGIEYQTIFFLAECNTKIIPTINPKNREQVKEVGQIQWNTYLQSLQKIRYYHKSRMNILKIINEYLMKQIS